MSFAYVEHEIGALSKCAVLDIGLKCPHSCEFCYYSFLDGSEDQFRGMRNATFRPLAECKSALDYFVVKGFNRIDITGGEPLYHPDIVEIVRYAEKEKNLRVRLITLGLLFERMDSRTGRKLLNALLEDAGITEFQLSLHAVDPTLYRKITKGNFQRVEAVMDSLDGMGFSYCTNTVVYANNAYHIPEIAAYLIDRKRNVHISNFITMNAYHAWANGRAFGVQARYSELAEPIRQATQLLESAGIAVNIRYGPYCAFRGLEKNLVGITGVQFDPYEWRNSTRNPFVVLAENEGEAYQLQRRVLPLDNKVFPPVCDQCSVRAICDGLDKQYLERYGAGELVPYTGPAVRDVVHFRRQNPAVFRVKTKSELQAEAMPGAAGRLQASQGQAVSRWALIYNGLRKFLKYKLYRRTYLAELPARIEGGAQAEWVDSRPWTGSSNQMLLLAVGASVEFRTQSPGKVWLETSIRQSDGDSPQRASAGKGLLVVEASDGGGKWREVGRFRPRGGDQWNRIRLRIGKGWQVPSALRLRYEGPAASRLALLEPSFCARRPIIGVAALVFNNLRYLGPKICWRKLEAWSYYGDREVQVV